MAKRTLKKTTHKTDILEGLNPAQRQAASHGTGPLLIIAGAGSGKTKTLVHRVAYAVQQGADPGRILLLTFTRRAAAEMLRRVEALVPQLGGGGSRRESEGIRQKLWGGTFHGIGTRLLRTFGPAIGLDPKFTIHDRGDSEDMLDVLRTDLGLAKTDKRFPRKQTCMAIYSHAVNSQRPLEETLELAYPWCAAYVEELKRLFRNYVDHKEACAVLDYDDLLVFWQALMADPVAGEKVRRRFDQVLVDEYQDTNRLQAEILRLLRPDGQGLTVVGDDAQSIYSFRAATIRNILDFPAQFAGTQVVKLEQNYRSTQSILEASNRVIAESRERYEKQLWSERAAGQQPQLVTCEDEDEQAEYLVQRILEHREAGIALRDQAVLFRSASHSMVLETELARGNIPFVKYGGLKFMETAHVKDLLALLRLAENPRDVVAGNRVLLLLPGIGPKKARQLMDRLLQGQGDFEVWKEAHPPTAARPLWPGLIKLMQQLTQASPRPVAAQVHLARTFYGPLLEEKYDRAEPRLRDLEQLEQLAARFRDRQTLLAELCLDPPASTEDLAGSPHLDEDYLILSTIHSAKGLEWDVVYVIHAADGNIPSDMAKTDEQMEEERRLFYVALTRAKNWLYVCFPQRYYQPYRGNYADPYGLPQLTRFLPPFIKRQFQHCMAGSPARSPEQAQAVRQAVRRQVKSLWS